MAADAQVPGPGCSHPIPKNVAIRDAQRGVRRGNVLDNGGSAALALSDASFFCEVILRIIRQDQAIRNREARRRRYREPENG